MRDFAEICRGLDGICGFRFPPGISTFGRQLEWSYTRLASPHGHRIGDVMAANCSPTPASDAQGVTSVIRSSPAASGAVVTVYAPP